MIFSLCSYYFIGLPIYLFCGWLLFGIKYHFICTIWHYAADLVASMQRNICRADRIFSFSSN